MVVREFSDFPLALAVMGAYVTFSMDNSTKGMLAVVVGLELAAMTGLSSGFRSGDSFCGAMADQRGEESMPF